MNNFPRLGDRIISLETTCRGNRQRTEPWAVFHSYTLSRHTVLRVPLTEELLLQGGASQKGRGRRTQERQVGVLLQLPVGYADPLLRVHWMSSTPFLLGLAKNTERSRRFAIDGRAGPFRGQA